ncbi:MAG: hypothetical protein QOF14_4120 [Hyphomicrobiales bacterium]|jgi:hypothetical protein|nr:hypothetical protein [Hyphomicrobiales bacterium]
MKLGNGEDKVGTEQTDFWSQCFVEGRIRERMRLKKMLVEPPLVGSFYGGNSAGDMGNLHAKQHDLAIESRCS